MRLRGKGKILPARRMNETIETEMNMVFLCDLEGNSPSRAEDACWLASSIKLLTLPFKMSTVYSPSEPSSSVHKVSRKQKCNN